ALLREALANCRRVLGAEDPATLARLSGLAYSLTQLDRWEEAEKLYRECLESQRRVLGADQRQMRWTALGLATLLRKRNRPEEAEPLYREIVESGRRSEVNADAILAMNQLGFILRDQGKFDEAETLLRSTVTISQRALGLEHKLTLGSMYHLVQHLLVRDK